MKKILIKLLVLQRVYMNERFLVVKYIKEFIFSIENLLINLPRKELLVKNRIMNDLYDILEFIYIANLGKDKNIKINIISKLQMNLLYQFVRD